MGAGASACDVAETATEMGKWSVLENQKWRYYDPAVQAEIIAAVTASADNVVITRGSNESCTLDFRLMKETNNVTGDTQDLRCEKSSRSQIQSTSSRYRVSQSSARNIDVDGVLAKEIEKFEVKLLEYLVSNSLRCVDVFHAIDIRRKGTVTRADLHSFCTKKIWPGMPKRVSDKVFSVMEIHRCQIALESMTFRDMSTIFAVSKPLKLWKIQGLRPMSSRDGCA
jgi:hypothetical protein